MDATERGPMTHAAPFLCVFHCPSLSANLSDTYFTTRQDRYILIRNEHLADFYSTLVANMKQLPFCHTITTTQPGQVPPPIKQPLGAAAGAGSEWEQRLAVGRSLSALFTPQPTTAADCKKRFTATTTSDEEADTWIFPTLQMVQKQRNARQSQKKRQPRLCESARSTLVPLVALLLGHAWHHAR